MINPISYFTIGSRKSPFVSFEATSKAWRQHIGNRGASQIKAQCTLFAADGAPLAYASYNGRIWEGPQTDWQPGRVPLHDPTTL